MEINGDYPSNEAVLEQGLRDMELLASGKATVREVCVVYGIPYGRFRQSIEANPIEGLLTAVERALREINCISLLRDGTVIQQLATAVARELGEEV